MSVIKFPEIKQVKNTMWTEADEFLAKCKFELSDEDYCDILEGIHDYKAYVDLDKDLKSLVDSYMDILNPDPVPPKTFA